MDMFEKTQKITTDIPFIKGDQEQIYQGSEKNTNSMPQPILVTGSPRSGTTWIGKMIASSQDIGYIYEPFHISQDQPGMRNVTFPCTFFYVTDENEIDFYDALRNTLSFHYNVQAGFSTLRKLHNVDVMLRDYPRSAWFRIALRKLRDVDIIARDYTRFAWYRVAHAIPLMKDPVALFSAEWLASRFAMRVVVTVRHPAAFVQSMKRMHWAVDFSNFSQQPLLMRDHLYPFEAKIAEYVKTEHDIIDQLIFMWRLQNHMVLKYAHSHKDWIFVRHEDITTNPLAGFEQIFGQLNLDFSSHVKKTIIDYTNEANPRDPKKGYELRKRNSKQIPSIWKEKLTSEEILRIRKGTEDISHHFYADDEW